MDQATRRAESEAIIGEAQTVSRRTFLNRARLGLLAMAGVAVFGIATTTGGASADEASEDEKKKGEEARDKDREAKEKEREGQQKEKKKSKKADKKDENKSNTKKKKSTNGDDSKKKKKKSTNGDDSKKKKKNKVKAPESPYAKYVVTKEDRHGCKDFPNQFDAQQVLRLEPKDPNGLDGNRNGIACDGQDAFMDAVPGGLMNQPFDLNPVTRP